MRRFREKYIKLTNLRCVGRIWVCGRAFIQRGKIGLVSDKLKILDKFPGHGRSYLGHGLSEVEEYMPYSLKKKIWWKKCLVFLTFGNWLSFFSWLGKLKTSLTLEFYQRNLSYDSSIWVCAVSASVIKWSRNYFLLLEFSLLNAHVNCNCCGQIKEDDHV